MAKERKFNTGDIVKLKSGGPSMTVDQVTSAEVESGKVRCQWFSGKKLEFGFFAPETLERVEA